MNLMQLKKAVDLTIENLKHQNPHEISVVITLSERSIGSRALSQVKYVGKGFDFENGQFRIEPSKDLVTRGNSLTDVKRVMFRQYDEKKYYFCPRCESKISKNDYYCRDCSQKLR
jgi:hypothetical protein